LRIGLSSLNVFLIGVFTITWNNNWFQDISVYWNCKWIWSSNK